MAFYNRWDRPKPPEHTRATILHANQQHATCHGESGYLSRAIGRQASGTEAWGRYKRTPRWIYTMTAQDPPWLECLRRRKSRTIPHVRHDPDRPRRVEAGMRSCRCSEAVANKLISGALSLPGRLNISTSRLSQLFTSLLSFDNLRSLGYLIRHPARATPRPAS